MTRRATIAAAAFAVAVAGSVLSSPVSAENVDDSCDSAAIVAGAFGGYVSPEDPEDWYRQPAVPGFYTVTLSSGPGNADLVVADSGCATLCGSRSPLGADVCRVHVTGNGIRFAATSGSPDLSGYTVTVALVLPSTTQCRDFVDNDGDGLTDMADADCGSVSDTSEGPDGCFPGHGVPFCVEVTPGAEVDRVVLDVPKSDDPDLEVYVDMYRFTRGPVSRDVPCVVARSGVADVSPCAAAGGKRVARVVGRRAPEAIPTSSSRPQNVLQVCEAVLTVTVGSLPPRSTKIYTQC